MNRSSTRARAPAARAAGLARAAMAAWALAALGGCASTAGGPADESRDRITASDESDASKRARVRLELASAYFGRGQMEYALDQVKLAIQADPTQSEAFNLRGLIYANLGDDRLAEESFRRALQLNPGDADAMQNFGWYLCQRKRFNEAHVQFEQALAAPRYRDSARTSLTQGICYSQAGQLDKAERSLVRANEFDPSNLSAAFNLADVLYQRKEYERARFYVRRVNTSSEVATAQSLWLAVRIENRLGQLRARQDLGQQLRRRFPDSREASAFERGNYDE
ncbi:MAG: type IV pilus biogenesis/stability protein PilW [Burkholderiaceae bacterium]